MMKYKVIKEEVVDTTTIVTIQTADGQFIGVSRCHPNDRFSTLRGSRFAEYKACTAALKAKRKEVKIKILTLENLIKQFRQLKHYNPQFQVEHFTQKELKKYQDELEAIDMDIAKYALIIPTQSKILAQLAKKVGDKLDN